MFAVGEGCVGPSVLVADAVVVAAEWSEVVLCGWAAVFPGGAVVEVASDGGHAAAGEDTRRVACFDGCVVVLWWGGVGWCRWWGLAGFGVGDGVAPLGVGFVVGARSGDVGDDGSVAGEVAGVVVGLCEGVEVDA